MYAPGLAILRAKTFATKPTKGTCPRTPAEKRGRMASPPTTTWKSTQLHNGLLIQDTPRSMPAQCTGVAVGECSRRVRDWRSMEEEWTVSLGVNNVASEQTDKTSSVTGQDANHSLVCASSSSPGSSPPTPRIKFPSSIRKTAWNELDRALGQGLRRLMKKESSMKMFTDCIHNISLVKFGQIPTKRPEEATNYQSKRQREIQQLRRKYFVCDGERRMMTKEGGHSLVERGQGTCGWLASCREAQTETVPETPSKRPETV